MSQSLDLKLSTDTVPVQYDTIHTADKPRVYLSASMSYIHWMYLEDVLARWKTLLTGFNPPLPEVYLLPCPSLTSCFLL